MSQDTGWKTLERIITKLGTKFSCSWNWSIRAAAGETSSETWTYLQTNFSSVEWEGGEVCNASSSAGCEQFYCEWCVCISRLHDDVSNCNNMAHMQLITILGGATWVWGPRLLHQQFPQTSQSQLHTTVPHLSVLSPWIMGTIALETSPSLLLYSPRVMGACVGKGPRHLPSLGFILKNMKMRQKIQKLNSCFSTGTHNSGATSRNILKGLKHNSVHKFTGYLLMEKFLARAFMARDLSGLS